MTKYFLMLLFAWTVQYSYSQKPLIGPSIYKKWPYLGNAEITSDGRYIFYEVKIDSLDGTVIKSIIQSVRTNWEMVIPNIRKSDIKFTNNGKLAVYLNKNDSLTFVSLGESRVKYIPHVASFDIVTNSEERLIYRLNNEAGTFILFNLNTGVKKKYSDVVSYEFTNNGKHLLLRTISHKKGQTIEKLRWIDLVLNNDHQFWQGKPLKYLLLDRNRQQVLLIFNNSIWYYNQVEGTPICLVKNVDSAIDSSLKLNTLLNFSKDGKRVFITLKARSQSNLKLEGVEVWSYRDPKLPSTQKKLLDTRYYIAVLDLSNHKIIRLQEENESFSLPGFQESPDTIGFIQCQSGEGPNSEFNWNVTSKVTNYLISTKNGKRTKMKIEIGSNMSPQGKYLIYFDPKVKNYFSYEISTGISRNITASLNVSWISKDRDDFSLGNLGGERGVATWLKDDKAVLVYDRYDIWKLDPSGKDKPINMTNGYGLKHRIIFYLGLGHYSNISISPNQSLVLNAFNTENKDNGFYSKDVSKIGDPELLTMGPFIYQLIYNSYVRDEYSYPIKARNEEVYLLRRMSATESPNYFTTKDFKRFQKLSDLHPEKDYNWYTTELHSWKSLDGKTLQGILYKPEDFDQNKKYPIIFYYYERKSDGLNVYLKPDFSSGAIDIATYVSNGYLVFSPDIYYKIGDPMQGTYDAVISAAKYAGNLSFVKSDKMGVQGHSFGGVQTNYLVTHTNLFAAACSASGLADLVSGYNTLSGNYLTEGYGSSLQAIYERGQSRMGATLWENLEGYVKNSAVFRVPEMHTPILLMHTKKDDVCPYPNIMEFFLGLRRLGKKAWMLVYPEGTHTVYGKESEDFTIRMQQFFDYYLKDKPAPIWMLDGVDASGRGIDSGFQLDSTGRTPGPGLLTLEEKKKVDSLMTVKPITITLK